MRAVRFISLVSAGLVAVGCTDSGRVVEPTAPAARSVSAPRGPAFASTGANARRVSVMDACDMATFNAAIGPGTCARNGGVRFPQFLAQLTAHQAAGAWHNAPAQTDAWLGETLVAHNDGGEVHTFTRVAEFGGGFIDFLNQLSGTPDPVPECLGLPAAEFMPPGGTDSEALDTVGDIKYQCCIHPWMRTTVHVKGT